MVLRWAKLTDARGEKRRFCPLLTAIKRSGVARDLLVIPGETPSLTQAYIHATAYWGIGLFGSLSYLEYTTGYGYKLLYSMPSVLYILVPSVLYVMLVGLMLHRNKWNTKVSVVSAMTRAGLCPSCAYMISEVKPADDGCTICPECGAAWNLTLQDQPAPE